MISSAYLGEVYSDVCIEKCDENFFLNLSLVSPILFGIFKNKQSEHAIQKKSGK